MLHKNVLYMIGSIIAIVALVLGGGAVAYSDTARPGDVLFAIDQRVERVRLSVASADKKMHLKKQFAEERLEELGELVSEHSHAHDSDDATVSVEVDIFRDTSVVIIEKHGAKEVYMSALRTCEQIASEVATKVAMQVVDIEQIIDCEIEDRVSRPEDSLIQDDDNISTDQAMQDIEQALEYALVSAEEVLPWFDESDVFVSTLAQTLTLLPEGVRLRVDSKFVSDNDDNGNDDSSDSNEDDIERVKIDIKKDGKVKIEIKKEDMHDDDSSDDSSDDSRGLEEIEVHFVDNTAHLKVEMNDVKKYFTLQTKDLNEIKSFLAHTLGVSIADVQSVIEVENDDSDDDSDDDDSDDDNDEDDSDDDNDEDDDSDDE